MADCTVTTNFTIYPCGIDSSDQLPKAVDNVTPVRGEVINRHRETLIAIESELGINPSGTFSTVKSRLDALEAGIGGVASSPGSISQILEEGVLVGSSIAIINFAGSIVTASSPSSDRVDITVVTPNLSEVLSTGNTTSGNDIEISSGDDIVLAGDGTNHNISYSSAGTAGGGSFTLSAQDAGGSGTGGSFTLNAGDSAGGSGTAGGINLNLGNPAGGTGNTLNIQQNSTNKIQVDPNSTAFAGGETLLEFSDPSVAGVITMAAASSAGNLFGIIGQSAGGTSQTGGDVFIIGGTGSDSAAGGDITIRSGASASGSANTGTGNINLNAAQIDVTMGGNSAFSIFQQSSRNVLQLFNTRDFDIEFSTASNAGDGHSINLTANQATNSSIGGNINLTGGVGGPSSGGGGHIVLTGGNASGGNFDGGHIEITPGTGTGTGDDGYVQINGLIYPSSDGTNGQAIVTDGAGNLSFSSVGDSGGNETLSQTLALGNTTDGYDIEISSGDAIDSDGPLSLKVSNNTIVQIHAPTSNQFGFIFPPQTNSDAIIGSLQPGSGIDGTNLGLLGGRGGSGNADGGLVFIQPGDGNGSGDDGYIQLRRAAGDVVISTETEVNVHDNKIINVVDPTNPQDAATKAYVDANAGLGGQETLAETLSFGDTSDGYNIHVVDGYFSVSDTGDDVPSIGDIRFGNNKSIYSIKADGSNDVPLLRFNSSNKLTIGSTLQVSGGLDLQCTGTMTFGNFNLNPGTEFTHQVIRAYQPSIVFDESVTTPSINQEDDTTSSATGDTLTLHAQDTTGATSTGGQLTVRSGTGTSSDGEIVLQRGTTTKFETSGGNTILHASSPNVIQTQIDSGVITNFYDDTGGSGLYGMSYRAISGATAAVVYVNTISSTANGIDLLIKAGDGGSGGSTNGGDLLLRPGNADGGTDGVVLIQDPSANTELSISNGTIDAQDNDVQTTGTLIIGSDPSTDTTADIRVDNATTIISARNASDDGDDDVLATTADGYIDVGDLSGGSLFEIRDDSIFIANMTEPATPTGGAVFYGSSGTIKGKGDSGTITTVVPAEPHCPNCGRDAAVEWQNPDEGWHIAVCMWCVTDALNNAGVIIKEQN